MGIGKIWSPKKGGDVSPEEIEFRPSPTEPTMTANAAKELGKQQQQEQQKQQQQQEQQTRRRSVSYQLRQTSVGGVKWDRRKIWGRPPEMCCINCDIEKKWIRSYY